MDDDDDNDNNDDHKMMMIVKMMMTTNVCETSSVFISYPCYSYQGSTNCDAFINRIHRSTPGLTVHQQKVVLDKSNKVLYTFNSYTKLLYSYCIFTFGRHSYCLQGTCKGACF